MDNKINASEIQRKGLKRVYEQIDNYESFTIENNRQDFTLYISKYKNNLGQVIQILRKYKREINKIGVDELHIFGSLATGKANSNSDVDLAFDLKNKEKLGLKKVIELTEELKELLEPQIKDLDIHCISMLKENIKEEVFNKGINVF